MSATLDRPTTGRDLISAAPLAADRFGPEATASDALWSRRAWYFVWLGVALRLIRFLRACPVWLDEQWLVLNLIDRDYAGLAGGLDHFQAAPVGFLWLEKGLVGLFGLNEYSLRGVALAAGVGGLIAFRVFAGRLLRGPALAAAVGTLAVSYFPIRHAAEFKPYALDLCTATLLTWAASTWFRDPARRSNAALLTATAVLTLPFSYPALFVVAGIGLAMLPTVVERRSPQVVAGYVAFGVVVAAAATAMYVFSWREQFAAATQTSFMHDYWADGFPPPWAKPWDALLWLLDAHAGEALAYPAGGKRFASLGTTLVVGVGVVAAWRRGDRALVRLAACILGVALFAAYLRRYPYGYGERLHQYWAPLVCLFIGVGTDALIRAIPRAEYRRRAMRLTMTYLCVLAAVWTGAALLMPYKHRWDRAHQSFARWFWQYASAGTPQLCLAGDLGRNLYRASLQPPYIVAREICRGPVPYAGGRDGFASIPAGSPIECVAYSLADDPRDANVYRAWTEAMAAEYRLVGERRYPIMIDDKPGKAATYYVWRFEPRSPQSHPGRIARPRPPTAGAAES